MEKVLLTIEEILLSRGFSVHKGKFTKRGNCNGWRRIITYELGWLSVDDIKYDYDDDGDLVNEVFLDMVATPRELGELLDRYDKIK